MKTKKKYQHSAFMPVGGVMKRIDVDAIVYIEARSYKCVFNMEDGTLYEVSMPMGEAIGFMDREQMKGQGTDMTHEHNMRGNRAVIPSRSFIPLPDFLNPGIGVEMK